MKRGPRQRPIRTAVTGLNRSMWPDLEHEACARETRDQLVGLVETQRDRLLDEQVLARVDDLSPDRIVIRGGNHDRNGLDPVHELVQAPHRGQPTAATTVCARAEFVSNTAHSSAPSSSW